MYLQKLRSYSFVTALLISACVPAGASVTVFTDRNLWLAATSPITTLDFTGATANNGDVAIGSIDLQGFDNFAETQHDLQVLNVNYWGSGAVLQGPGGNSQGQHIIATLPAGVFAVGSDIMLYDGSQAQPISDTGTISVQLSTGTGPYSAVTIGGFSSRAFIGFVSTNSQISSITFFPSSDPTPHLVLDNFSTGGQAAVDPAPEAATMILCGGGLLLIGLVRRHRNSAAKPPRGA